MMTWKLIFKFFMTGLLKSIARNDHRELIELSIILLGRGEEKR